MSNWIFGVLGVGATYGVGTRWLGLSWQDIAFSIAVSNVSGLVSLLLTLQAERMPWIRARILNRSLKTWALITTLYVGIMLAFVPALRDVRVMATLFLPLLFSTGFMIPLFGVIQDSLVRGRQRQQANSAVS